MKKAALPFYALLVIGFFACMQTGGILSQALLTPYFSTDSYSNAAINCIQNCNPVLVPAQGSIKPYRVININGTAFIKINKPAGCSVFKNEAMLLQ